MLQKKKQLPPRTEKQLELSQEKEQPWGTPKRQSRPNLRQEEQLELQGKVELQRTVEQPWKKRQNRPNLHLEEQLEL